MATHGMSSVIVKYQDFSCCGIILDAANGIILTLGSIISDLFPKIDKPPSLSSLGSQIWWSNGDEVPVEVLLKKTENARVEDGEIVTLDGCLKLLWRDKKLEELTQHIFPVSEWHFDYQTNGKHDSEGEKHKSATGGSHKLADFALIHVKALSDHVPSYPKLLDSLRLTPAQQGEVVFLVGTPFGSECPHVFYNSISKGIVSNLAGTDGEILMTDARCVPGSEGGLLLLCEPASAGDSRSRSYQLYGIVVAPFCWRNGEWIGITLACSIKHILLAVSDLICLVSSQLPVGTLQELNVLFSATHFTATRSSQKTANSTALNIFNERLQDKMVSSPDSPIHKVEPNTSVGIVQKVFPSVVLVQHGMMWGTGVIIDSSEALVVTCSHVIRATGKTGSATEVFNQWASRKSCNIDQTKKMQDIKVGFGFPNPVWQSAEVLFATDSDCPLDFALLRIPSHSTFKSILIRRPGKLTDTKALYRKNEETLVVGFALLPSYLKLSPSVTSGVLSNVLCDNTQAVMLQCSAAVHSGASGGALISGNTGELLGIVTSNVRDAHNSTSFPHVNFSIPGTLVEQIISLVKMGNAGSGLESVISQRVAEIWNLQRNVEPLSLISKL